jgi:hypothetical protein
MRTLSRHAIVELVMRVRLSDKGRMSMRQERMLGVAMLVAGLALVGVSISRMGPEAMVQAQVAPQTPAQRDEQPGARPTTPAPEPARPQSKDNEGATTGSSPPKSDERSPDRPPATGTPLPPAPAEKTAPPIRQ